MIRLTILAAVSISLMAGVAMAQSVTDPVKRDACMQKAKEAGLSGKGANQILAKQRKDFMKKCMAGQ